MSKSIIYLLLSILIIFASDTSYVSAISGETNTSSLNPSECKTCEGATDGIIHCSPSKCPEPPASFEEYASSPQGQEVTAILSEVKNSEDVPDTIHENEKVLKAVSLFLHLSGIKDLGEDKMERLFYHLLHYLQIFW